MSYELKDDELSYKTLKAITSVLALTMTALLLTVVASLIAWIWVGGFWWKVALSSIILWFPTGMFFKIIRDDEMKQKEKEGL